jgi:hypothetical protein
MTFHSGIRATATIGGTTNELPITKWSVTPKVDIVQFRNSKTGKFSLKEATFYDCDFSITVDRDFDANPFDAPFGLIVGATITGTHLYVHGSADIFWLFPSAIVVGTPNETEVDGKESLTFDFTAAGTFSYPGAFTPA